MPHMTGIELAQAIHHLRPGVPIIICSGYSTIINAENAASFGIRKFLPKPIPSQELLASVRELLAHDGT
jgi:YesN/AraC family two-component response regulator